MHLVRAAWIMLHTSLNPMSLNPMLYMRLNALQARQLARAVAAALRQDADAGCDGGGGGGGGGSSIKPAARAGAAAHAQGGRGGRGGKDKVGAGEVGRGQAPGQENRMGAARAAGAAVRDIPLGCLPARLSQVFPELLLCNMCHVWHVWHVCNVPCPACS